MKKTLAVLLVCVIVALAGCGGVLSNQSVRDGEISLEPIAKSEPGTFAYHGGIQLDGAGESCINNLTVSLYSANLTKLNSVHIGTLCYTDEAPDRKNITLGSDIQPAYIVLESPDFWDEDLDPSPSGMVRTGDSNYYRAYPIESPDQVKPQGDIANPVPTNQSDEAHNRTTHLFPPSSGFEHGIAALPNSNRVRNE